MQGGDLELELVSRAARGDEGAFRSLVERHARMVWNLAYRLTADRAAAEDVVQETFLRAYRALDRFDGRAAFSTWVHRIGRNAALDHLRQRQVRAEVALEPEEGVAVPAPDPHPGPERLALSADLRRALERAMAGLTELERVAFVLRHHEGRTTEEIGAELGLQPSATRQAVFRAVRKLRLALAPLMTGAQPGTP